MARAVNFLRPSRDLQNSWTNGC